MEINLMVCNFALKISSLKAATIVLILQWLGLPVSADTLERNAIARFHITESTDGKVIKLHIKGGCGYSAAMPGPLETRVKGDVLLLVCKLKHVGKPIPFDYVVHIPPGVKRALFGAERKEIWPKDEVSVYSDEQTKALNLAKAKFMADHPDQDLENFYVGPEIGGDGYYDVLFRFDAPTTIKEIVQYHYRVSKSDFSVFPLK